MSFKGVKLFVLLTVQCLMYLCVSQSFDHFYFVQQWPGSYCDTKRACCYPTTGKPATDFSIHGLWPNYNNGSCPSNCNKDSYFNSTEISDLTSRMQKSWPTISCPTSDGTKFWSHEWSKHVTCSDSILSQHDYFEAALNIKDKVNLLQYLKIAGIEPNGSSYSLEAINRAIKDGVGHAGLVERDRDAKGNYQLFQVYVCVNTNGTEVIECPRLPKRKCNSTIEFPAF